MLDSVVLGGSQSLDPGRVQQHRGLRLLVTAN
jgi:hypothetical protein